MKTTHDYYPALVKGIGRQRLMRMSGVLLALPVVVIAVISGIYLVVWKTDPLIRFSHMILVLGFWMAGTVATFAFILPARARAGLPVAALNLAILFILLAIFFTPLPRFMSAFRSHTSLILAALTGLLHLFISVLIVLRFRNKISAAP